MNRCLSRIHNEACLSCHTAQRHKILIPFCKRYETIKLFLQFLKGGPRLFVTIPALSHNGVATVEYMTVYTYTHVAIVYFTVVNVLLYMIMYHQHNLQNAIAKSVSICGVGLHSLWAPDRRLQSVACHHPGDDNCVAKFSVWQITCIMSQLEIF